MFWTSWWWILNCYAFLSMLWRYWNPLTGFYLNDFLGNRLSSVVCKKYGIPIEFLVPVKHIKTNSIPLLDTLKKRNSLFWCWNKTILAAENTFFVCQCPSKMLRVKTWFSQISYFLWGSSYQCESTLWFNWLVDLYTSVKYNKRHIYILLLIYWLFDITYVFFPLSTEYLLYN